MSERTTAPRATLDEFDVLVDSDLETDATLVEVILSPTGRVAGALLASEKRWEVFPVRAKAVVLTEGAIDALYPDPRDPRATGNAIAIAHRAGARLSGVTVTFSPAPAVAGLATDEHGATSVPGLFAGGSASSTRTPPGRVAARAARGAPAEFPPFGPYRVTPNVDSPLPRGFAEDKLARLQNVMHRHFGPDPAEVGTGIQLLLRLKGEADEFARARVQRELFALQNAVEVALLIARSTRSS